MMDTVRRCQQLTCITDASLRVMERTHHVASNITGATGDKNMTISVLHGAFGSMKQMIAIKWSTDLCREAMRTVTPVK